MSYFSCIVQQSKFIHVQQPRFIYLLIYKNLHLSIYENFHLVNYTYVIFFWNIILNLQILNSTLNFLDSISSRTIGLDPACPAIDEHFLSTEAAHNALATQQSMILSQNILYPSSKVLQTKLCKVSLNQVLIGDLQDSSGNRNHDKNEGPHKSN